MEATCHLRAESVERFSGDVTKVKDELDATAATDLVLIACHNEAEKKRLGDVLAGGQFAAAGRLHLVVGHVHAGFRLVLERRRWMMSAASWSWAITSSFIGKRLRVCCRAGSSKREPSIAFSISKKTTSSFT